MKRSTTTAAPPTATRRRDAADEEEDDDADNDSVEDLDLTSAPTREVHNPLNPFLKKQPTKSTIIEESTRRKESDVNQEKTSNGVDKRRTIRRDDDDDEEEEDDDDDEDDEDRADAADDEDAAFALADDSSLTTTTTSTRKYRQPKLKFDLSTFNSSFDAAAFVSELTHELFEQQIAATSSPSTADASLDEFDPEPFSTLFSSALQRLDSLRDETDLRIRSYADQCRRDEEVHRENLSQIQQQMMQTMAQFNRLDSRISSVAHTAVRIGHTLQSVDTAKRNNLIGQEIISYFIAFNEGVSKIPQMFLTAAGNGGGGQQDDLRNSNTDVLHRAAEMIQILSNISLDIRVKGIEKATELIAKTSNDIENQLIARFDLSSAKNDRSDMKACACTLLNFRGRNIIKRFVFNVIEKVDKMADELSLMGGGSKAAASSSAASPTAKSSPSSSPSASPTHSSHHQHHDEDLFHLTATDLADITLVGLFHTRLLRYYKSIHIVLRETIDVSGEIFPAPLVVLKALLERVFNDTVSGLIDGGLNDKRLSVEEYLKCLEFTHRYTVELVASLQSDIRTMTMQASLAHAQHHRGGGSASGAMTVANSSSSFSSSSTTGEQVSMLNLMDHVHSIFSSYREAYFSRELSLIQSHTDRLISETLKKEAVLDTVTGDQTDMFGRMKKEVVYDRKQKWIGIVLEEPLVDRIISQLCISLQRCDKLSDASLIAEHTSTMFLYVVNVIYEKYLLPILNLAEESLPPLLTSDAPKQQPDVFYYSVVGLINLIVDKLNLHLHHWIQPRLSVNANIQVVCESRYGEILGKVETQICTGLMRCLAGVVRYSSKILSSKQKSSDYKPKECDDNSTILDGKPSAACEALCTFIKGQYDAIVTYMDGKNLDKLLMILGLKLHELVERESENHVIVMRIIATVRKYMT